MGAVQGVLDAVNSTLIDNFPILYWNDRDQALVELTTDAADAPADTNTINNLAAFRPGNGLGNAYPSISIGPADEIVVIWQQWEDDGTGRLVNVFPAGGVDSIFVTDIWGAVSVDGGATWSTPEKIAGTPGASDVYPVVNKDALRDGDSLVIDFVYMEDLNPGVSLFGEGDASETIWYYERASLFAPVTGIEETATVVENFSLSQNYPNPFNPTTTISYSLDKAADISLDVYNVIGQKVATLASGRVNAGEYTADFDASSLASGLYFYTLTSGDVSITKKMVLMK